MIRDIRFTSLLHLSDEEMTHLKLVFNSNWKYEKDEQAPEIQELFDEHGYNESKFLDLLSMYVDDHKLIMELTKTHNPNGQKRFKNGDIAFCFIPYSLDNKEWLLVNVFAVLDENRSIVATKEGGDYWPLFGRLVVRFEGKSRRITVRDPNIIGGVAVETILRRPYYELADKFPGYENVDLSWKGLRRALKNPSWRTALENQKGVYLITDIKTNKRYVGSASGDGGILGRWQIYAGVNMGRNREDAYNGGNKELKELSDDYIKDNFRYSILDVFSMKTSSEIILARESWWKNILMTRNDSFGYNDN